jgi:hypothetical protein
MEMISLIRKRVARIKAMHRRMFRKKIFLFVRSPAFNTYPRLSLKLPSLVKEGIKGWFVDRRK